MKKLLLILVVMSFVSGCKTELYAMQPYNPMCLKLKYYKLAYVETETITTENLVILETNRMAIKQECGE
jgi:hypothetical protein